MIFYCQACGTGEDVQPSVPWPRACRTCHSTSWGNVAPETISYAAADLVCRCPCHRTVGQPVRAVGLLDAMETAVACAECFTRHRAAQAAARRR